MSNCDFYQHDNVQSGGCGCGDGSDSVNDDNDDAMTRKLPESNSVGGKKQFHGSPLLPSHLGRGNHHHCRRSLLEYNLKIFIFASKGFSLKGFGNAGCSIHPKPTHSMSQLLQPLLYI